MRTPAAVIALGLALTGCTTGPGYRQARDIALTANPSAVVATELAFARAAQEKGQWTAFREFAAKDAVMFVPEPVNARDWLRRQANPPQAVRWQPHQVWSSCDGSLAVTRGAWQRPDGTFGYFTTVWQRQNDRDYRWILDHGDATAAPLPAPEMIAATSADCGTMPVAASSLPAFVGGKAQPFASNYAADATVRWSYNTTPDGLREVVVELWDGADYEIVVEDRIGEGG